MQKRILRSQKKVTATRRSTMENCDLLKMNMPNHRRKEKCKEKCGATGTELMSEADKEVGIIAPPPKSLLLYLVRMGSFTSTTKICNGDSQDDDITVDNTTTSANLLHLCHEQLTGRPPLLPRMFTFFNTQACLAKGPRLRIMQWNILSQALGKQNDNFVACPEEALEWQTRRFRLLEEILTYNADILCLQEVDHFNFLQKMLGSIGYKGIFFPKPDSPCIYIEGNNGPDGCAIFYNDNLFDVVKIETRVLEVWRVQSNQVVILVILRIRGTNYHVCVVTTHLKARQGALLSTLRNEQGKDLLDFVRLHYGNCPLIICGDFNAEPNEPIYSTLLGNRDLNVLSCYAALNNKQEPSYTTWKIREDGEVCHTIDYIFCSQKNFQVVSTLQFPSEEEIGKGRVPSLQYPSDHFSLIADLMLNFET